MGARTRASSLRAPLMPNAWITQYYGRSLALATDADAPLDAQALGSGPQSLSPARTLSPPPDRASRAAPVDAVTLLFQALDSDGVRTLRGRYATPSRWNETYPRSAPLSDTRAER